MMGKMVMGNGVVGQEHVPSRPIILMSAGTRMALWALGVTVQGSAALVMQGPAGVVGTERVTPFWPSGMGIQACTMEWAEEGEEG